MEESRAVYSRTQRVIRGFIFLFLAFVAVLILYPIVYIVLGSFKENAELLRGGANPMPTHFVIENYIQAWEQANFAAYTKNSIFISLGVMVITLVVCSMAGYVFDRKKFRGKEFLYGLFIAFMFVNVGSVALRPLFELSVALHLNTSLFTVVLISAGMSQATNIFLVRGYMASIPKEIDEAAKIDGCSFFGIYWRIALPLLKPVLATIGLLSFRQGWNEYILPLVFTISNDSMRPLTVGVTMLKNAGDGAAAWNIMFAGSTISIVPILIVYLFASKYFMKGMTSGAVKG